MAVPISNVTRRQVYAPSGSGGAGPYAFTFEILANTDIAVFKDDTLLTLTTHYTVTINANGTGSVTITATGLALAPLSPTQYAIVGNRTISRTTDFTTGGDFFANTLNDELDQQTIFAQQNAEGLDRALQAPQTDPTSINMTLPRKVFRAGKLLAFNSTTGNPEVGPDLTNFSGIYQGAYATAPSTRFDTSPLQAGDLYFDSTSDSMRVYTGGAWQEIAPEMAIGHQAYIATAAQVLFYVTNGYNVNSLYVYLNGVLLDAADYTATNGTSIVLASGATLNDTIRVVTYFHPVDTISIRDAAAASAAAAATSASNAASASASATSSASAASTSASNAASSASSASTSASNASSSATAASNSAAAAAASYDAFDDRYLGSKNSDPTVDNDGNTLIDGALYWNTVDNILKIYDAGASIWRRTTPTTGEQANIDTVTGIAANVTTVAGISGNVTTVAGISANVTSVAGNSTNINTVATNIVNVNAVGGNISNVNSVAGNATNINAAVSNASNINTVAGSIANVNTVGGSIASVNTVASELGVGEDVTVVAANLSGTNTVGTVAGSIANVNAVSTNISNVNAVNSNATNINTVAANNSNISTVAGISANVTTVAGISANVTTVAGNNANVTTVATNIAAVQDAVPNAALALASANAAASSETAAAASATSALASQVAAAASAVAAATSATNAAASAVSADQSAINAAASAFAASADPYNINTDTDFGLITDAGLSFFADETANFLLTMNKGSGAFTYGSV
jgi:hypothetical protein